MTHKIDVYIIYVSLIIFSNLCTPVRDHMERELHQGR